MGRPGAVPGGGAPVRGAEMIGPPSMRVKKGARPPGRGDRAPGRYGTDASYLRSVILRETVSPAARSV